MIHFEEICDHEIFCPLGTVDFQVTKSRRKSTTSVDDLVLAVVTAKEEKRSLIPSGRKADGTLISTAAFSRAFQTQHKTQHFPALMKFQRV